MPGHTYSGYFFDRGVELSENVSERAAYLAQLGIFIEHSNGEREVVAGKPVPMPDGQLGLPKHGQHLAYISGYTDGQFKPLENVTREQFAAMIARNLGYTEESWSGEAPFLDVKKTSWAAGAIAFVKEKGLMQGRADGNFKPNDAVTRTEIATVIVNYRDLAVDTSGKQGFNDIAEHWAQWNIKAAQTNV